MPRGGNQTTLTLRLIDGVSKPGRSIAMALGGVNRAVSGLKGGAMAPLALGSKAASSFATNLGAVQANSVVAAAGVTALFRQVLSTERNLNKTVAAGNLTQEQRTALYKNAIDLNYKYGGSVNDVINAHNELLRSGLDFNKSSAALPDVMNLSQATGEDTISVARAIVTNLTALRLGMDQTTRAADLFVQALDRTAGVDLIDFETSGKYFNPVAAATGQSAEEAMAFQIEMATRGLSGSSAGTGLRAAPMSILAPTKKARAALEGLGVDPAKFRGKRTAAAGIDQILGALGASGIDTETIEPQIAQIMSAKLGESEKIKAIIGQLGEELGIVTADDRSEITQTLSRAFASGVSNADLAGFLVALKRAGAGAADYEAIFGRNHANKMLGFDPVAYDRELALLRADAKGGTDRKSTTMMAGLPGDVNEAEGALQGFIAALSNAGVLKDFSTAAKVFAKTFEEISKQSPGLLRAGFAVAAFLAALAPVGLIATGAAAGLALLLNPITLVGAALAGWAVLNWGALTNGFRTFGNHLRKALDPSIAKRMDGIGDSMRRFISGFRLRNTDLNKFAAGMGTGLGNAINQFANITPNLDGVMPKIRELSATLMQFGTDAAEQFGPKIKQGVDSLSSLFSSSLDSKVGLFRDLGNALMEFGPKVTGGLSPAVAPAIDLVAESFNTMASGAELVGSALSTAQDGIAGFASNLLANIKGEDLKSLGDSLGNLFNAIKEPVRMLGDGFRYLTGGLNDNKSSFVSFSEWAGGGAGEVISGVFRTIASAIDTLTGAIRSVIGAWQTMVEGFKTSIPMPGIGGLGVKLPQAPMNLGGNWPKGPAGPPMPRRANGGAVRNGPYLVGERGPEIVHMGRNGYVTPNHRLGVGGDAAGPITIQVNGAGDPRAVAREVRRELNAAVSRSQQIGLNR